MDLTQSIKISIMGREMFIATANQQMIAMLTDLLTLRIVRRQAGKYVSEPLEIYAMTVRNQVAEIITFSGLIQRVVSLAEQLSLNVAAVERIYEGESNLSDPIPMENAILLPGVTGDPKLEDWDKLRDWQQETMRLMLNCRFGQIKVSTGGGKSHLIAQYCRRAWRDRICVTTGDIADLDNLYRAILNVGVDAAIVKAGASRELRSARVICTTTKSLHHVDNIRFDTLLCDEAHRMAAISYRSALWKIKSRKAFAFSANIGDRADKADLVVEGIFGPKILERAYSDNLQAGDVVPIYYRFIETSCTRRTTSSNPATRAACYVVNNQARNQQIADAANYYLENGQQVLILVNTVEHVLRLCRLLPGAVGVYRSVEESVKLKLMREKVWSDQYRLHYNDKQMAEVQQSFADGFIRVVVANSVWHKGKDFPGLKVLIRGDARSTVEANTQLAGRLSRTCEGKQYGLLIDCLDDFDPSLKAAARKRKSNYIEKGWQDWMSAPPLFEEKKDEQAS